MPELVTELVRGTEVLAPEVTAAVVEEAPGAVVVGAAGAEVVVVPGAAAEVLVVPEAESELEEPPFKQLLSGPAWTVTAADCAVAPVWSRSEKPSRVLAWKVTRCQENDVAPAGCSPRSAMAGPEGSSPLCTDKKKGPWPPTQEMSKG